MAAYSMPQFRRRFGLAQRQLGHLRQGVKLPGSLGQMASALGTGIGVGFNSPLIPN
jgi:hypothetical protein